MLEEFAPSLYRADGPTVPFLGFPYGVVNAPTITNVTRLHDDFNTVSTRKLLCELAKLWLTTCE